MPRAFLIAILACGCATVPKQPAFLPPSVSFQELRIDRLDFESADVTALYAVRNPNAGTVNLSGIFFLFQANGRPVDAGRPPEVAELPPGNSWLAFPVKLIWERVVPVYPAVGPDERMHYLATGSANIDTPGGPQRIDLAHEDTMAMPELPAIVIDPPKLVALTPLGAQMTLNLRLVNRAGYRATVAGVEAQVALGAGSIGKLTLPPQGEFEAHQEKAVTATVDLAFTSAGIEVSRTLRDGGALLLVIDGSMAVGDWGMPVHAEQAVTVQRPEPVSPQPIP